MCVNELSLSDPCNEGRIVEVFTKSSGKLAQNDDDVMLRLNVFYRYAICMLVYVLLSVCTYVCL